MEENSVKNKVRPQNKHLKPLKKGETANPNGRPLGQRNYSTIYREALLILADKNATTPEKLEAEMIANAAILARKGDYRFYKDVIDRAYGSAPQMIEIKGDINTNSFTPEEQTALLALLND
jgi:hypothetical protein